TASVTAAPAEASALTVSIPIPPPPPVTMARFPCKSNPSITSAALDLEPKVVVMRSIVVTLYVISAPSERTDQHTVRRTIFWQYPRQGRLESERRPTHSRSAAASHHFRLSWWRRRGCRR